MPATPTRPLFSRACSALSPLPLVAALLAGQGGAALAGPAPQSSSPSRQAATNAAHNAATQTAATPAAPAASKGAETRGAPEMGFTLVSPGQGATPTLADTVLAHYRGTLPDGTEFDSSYKRGQAASFPLGRMIKCWQQGLQRMQVGAKAKLVCPPELAYGSRGAGQVIPPNATLHFDVELLGVTPPAPAPLPAPAPAPAAPAEPRASKEASAPR